MHGEQVAVKSNRKYPTVLPAFIFILFVGPGGQMNMMMICIVFEQGKKTM